MQTKPAALTSAIAEPIEPEVAVATPGTTTINDLYTDEGARLFVDEQAPSNNKLKKEGSGITVSGNTDDMSEYPLHDLHLIEKDEEPVVQPVPAPVRTRTKPVEAPPFALEIKPTEDDPEIEEPYIEDFNEEAASEILLTPLVSDDVDNELDLQISNLAEIQAEE